jgi:hypothetical protein
MPKLLILFALAVLTIAGSDTSSNQSPSVAPTSTATGYRAYIEEYRHDLQHPDYQPSEHHANTFHDILSTLPQPQNCVQSLSQGLIEFTDFGPLNNLPWNDVFVVSPGHPEVTGKTHFAFLDAYGARLKGGQLEVFVDKDAMGNEGGFQTKAGHRLNNISMHYEASAFGYGRGDSQALSPPLLIRAVSKSEVMREVAAISSSGSSCYCDIIVPSKVSYVLGLLYYPQFGHTIFNGLSNMVATLWRKQVPVSDVEFSPYLFRNTSTDVSGVPSRTYRLQWFDMYNELFSFYSSGAGVTPWTHFLDYTSSSTTSAQQGGEARSICFQRLMVGALPHLDHMNVTVPLELWARFSRGVIAHLFWRDLELMQEGRGGADTRGGGEVGNTRLSSPHDISEEYLRNLLPRGYPDYHRDMGAEEQACIYSDGSDTTCNLAPRCAVTIVTRDIHNARSIVNAQALADVAESRGCGAQLLSLEGLSLRDQVGAVRWNSTLLVSVDGTALLNALFMHKCSTVLYVEMWRRAMMIPQLGPSVWTGYSPRAADTSFANTSDPIALHMRAMIISAHTSSAADAGADAGADLLESMSLASLPFPHRDIEDFLRNGQSTSVRLDAFERVLDESIRHNWQCRRATASSMRSRSRSKRSSSVTSRFSASSASSTANSSAPKLLLFTMNRKYKK